tara:strand:- start:10661 stop:11026 length:366 start_codon:yes stop_codon:yes gene_type:complete
MDKYAKSIIYGIRCKTTNKLYIGSSTESLKTRLSKHITDLRGYMGYKNNKPRNYRSSFEVLFNENYEIFEIEEYQCNCKRELEIRESLHIYNNDCVNKRLAVKINPKDYDLTSLPSCPSLT